ncbi:hypothetical protein TPA0907_30540 [Micromonospora humidisoli]|nr:MULTISPECIES: ribosome-inactivating family protein [Micromonospora]GHJ08687.1 hypothetical protein TPA0907_30540 [Micromonospora sp. AKA109]
MHRLVRAVVGSAVALVMAAGGTAVSSGPASATIPTDQLRQVYLIMEYGPGDNQMIRYSSFLAAVRNAVSDWADSRGGLVTQTNRALLRVTLEYAAQDVDLWIDPQNLYVLGFSTQRGATYAFSDQAGTLRDRFSRTTNSSWYGVDTNVQTLYFTSNYGSIEGAANRSRTAMLANFQDVAGSIGSLARMENPTANPGGRQQEAARSLQTLIGFVSEGARFNDIEGIFRQGMRSYNNAPITLRHAELENQWSAISSAILGWSYGATNTYTVRLGGNSTHVISTIAQARQYVRVAQY